MQAKPTFHVPLSTLDGAETSPRDQQPRFVRAQPVSVPPAGVADRPTRFEVADVLHEFAVGMPVVTLAMTALLSEEELLAALFVGTEFMTASEVADLTDDQVHTTVACVLAWDGMRTIRENLTRIDAGPLDRYERARVDACMDRIVDAFDLPVDWRVV